MNTADWDQPEVARGLHKKSVFGTPAHQKQEHSVVSEELGGSVSSTTNLILSCLMSRQCCGITDVRDYFIPEWDENNPGRYASNEGELRPDWLGVIFHSFTGREEAPLSYF